MHGPRRIRWEHSPDHSVRSNAFRESPSTTSIHDQHPRSASTISIHRSASTSLCRPVGRPSEAHGSQAALPRCRAPGSRAFDFTPGPPRPAAGSEFHGWAAIPGAVASRPRCLDPSRSFDPSILLLFPMFPMLRTLPIPLPFSRFRRRAMPPSHGTRSRTTSNPGERADGASNRLVPTPTVCRMCNVSQMTPV
jgi:hypothetical protein